MAYRFETEEELRRFIQEQVLTTSEALEYLGISRQALNSLVQRNKISPVKETAAIKLFLKSDLDKRVQAMKTR